MEGAGAEIEQQWWIDKDRAHIHHLSAILWHNVCHTYQLCSIWSTGWPRVVVMGALGTRGGGGGATSAICALALNNKSRVLVGTVTRIALTQAPVSSSINRATHSARLGVSHWLVIVMAFAWRSETALQ